MNIVMVSIGSYGDLHPLLGIGSALRRRGHAVTFLTNEYFEADVQNSGLDFVSIGGIDDYAAMLKNPEWIRTVCDTSLRPVRAVYACLSRNYAKGAAVALCNASSALGVRLAREKFGMPMITLNLMPFLFMSTCSPPLFTFSEYPEWVPRWFFSGVYGMVHAVYDHYLRPPLNDFRREIALPPQPRCVLEWMISPDKVIGLFPDWFGRVQPDWPAQTELTGFPLFDDGDMPQGALPREVEAFLSEGRAPIVFTPGTPNSMFSAFFEKAVAAVSLLGARALFISKHKEQIPCCLPDTIRFFEYLPFSRVFPRASLLVHHGGIGTAAQAMRAGLPQLITPWGFDQFDNGFRIRQLGIGEVISSRKCTVESLAAALSRLSAAPAVKARCAVISRKVAAMDPLADTCRIIESVAGQHLTGTAAQQAGASAHPAAPEPGRKKLPRSSSPGESNRQAS